MTLVKICGITNLDDALGAIDAGADLLGFNFYRHSPRYIHPEQARAIIDQLPHNVATVGVFVNEKREEIEQIATTSGVSVLQLHGNESREYCQALQPREMIKVFHTDEDFVPEVIVNYEVQAVMLDTGDQKTFGGTGKLSNWTLARMTRELFPKLFLAGGLSPENVAAAIGAVDPYAVYACSSLESAPGRKDHERMRAFVAAVRAASV
jgi:phosphoribosylanthranilate isomerase